MALLGIPALWALSRFHPTAVRWGNHFVVLDGGGILLHVGAIGRGDNENANPYAVGFSLRRGVFPPTTPPSQRFRQKFEMLTPYGYSDIGSSWLRFTSYGGVRCNLAFNLWMPLPAVTLIAIWLLYRDRRRIVPGCCVRCGYDLFGNVSGICPECGTPIIAAKMAGAAAKSTVGLRSSSAPM